MLRLIALVAPVAFGAALLVFGLFPERQGLAAHLAFALGVLPLILAAMTFFVPVLTRTRAAGRFAQILPIVALAGGFGATLGFADPAVMAVAHGAGALMGASAALGMSGWILWRVHRAVGTVHPGLWWYVAALACLALALAAILAMPFVPEARPDLRRLHLHLNTLGFVALTAVGTLQVLLPTVAGTPDPQAAARLRSDLGWALAGALAIAVGAVVDVRLAVAGFFLWAVPLARLAQAWWRQFRAVLFAARHPGASLGAALLGLALALVAGVLHALHWLPAAPSVPALLILYHLPLVTGALSHLLPLWWYAGRSARREQAMRTALVRHSALRAVLFLAGGTLVLLSVRAGLVLAFAGLLLFVGPLARVLYRTRAVRD